MKQQPSPETYIKTRARSLPVANCYVTSDWRDTGIATIVVTRKHTNGNFTAGLYLIDLYCLGLKDTFYMFNVESTEIDHTIRYGDFVEVDYPTVHNIIYGAIAFADDYGFKPHKDWKLTTFILEEDDDRVELIDIPFGRKGKPFYVSGPNDSEQRVEQVLATLERTAGEGNFYFAYGDDFDDEVDADADFDDELFDPEEIGDILSGKKEATLPQLYALTTAQYLMVNEQLSYESDISAEYLEDLAEHDVDHEVFYTLDKNRDKTLSVLYQEAEKSGVDSAEDMMEFLESVRTDDPENLLAGLLLLEILYLYVDKPIRANRLRDELMAKYPDVLYVPILTAFYYMKQGNLSKGMDWVNGSYYINYAFRQRQKFTLGEFILFNCTLCLYFLNQDRLDEAIIYGGMVVEHAESVLFVKYTIQEVCHQLIDFLDPEE